MKKISLSLISLMAIGAILAGKNSTTLNVRALNKLGSLENAGKFSTDFETFADAKAAANDLNEKLSEEGNTLLKNVDDTLPMPVGSRLSVFGVTQDNLVGGSDESITDSLEKAGFKVNPTLRRFYDRDSSSIRDENLNFSASVKNSYDLYNDGAVMVISREGGEGADLVTVEDETVGSDDYHENLFVDSEGKKHRHYLMLSQSEEKLYNHLRANFDKIHIIINSSHILEVGQFKDDNLVKSILWIGRPGESGIDAVGKIYSGEVNPSGSVVDEWERDFTADPTWQNFGDNSQTGSTNLYKYADGTDAGANSLSTTFPPMMPGFHGVDYEEGIYLGYRYYESYYKDVADEFNVDAANDYYENYVAYPFGYGLSYTKFSTNIVGLYTDEDCTHSLGATVSGDKFASDKTKGKAEIEKLYLEVTVKNEGNKAGKKAVQVYVTAPYTKGGIEKSFVTFSGFAKTDLLKPGESENVIVEFNVQDFASYDANDKNANGNKGYELDQGEYTVRVMNGAHFDLGTDIEDKLDDYDEIKFNLTSTANLKLDDFSHNEVGNLFSEENGMFYSVRKNRNVNSSAGMTIMSRSDFDGTFPKAPTTADLTFPDEFYSTIHEWECFDADNTETYAKYDTKALSEKAPWVNDIPTELPSNWTQGVDNGKYSLMDIAGVDKDSDAVLTEGVFKGKTGKQAWETFMNSLTWDEMVSLPMNGGWSTVGIDSIGLKTSVDNDSPEDFHSTHLWCDSPTIAATMNLELAAEEGIIIANLGLLDLGENLTGWYGSGMDTHRTPFSGRNNQYYSQDGLHAGYFAAAVVGAAESRGLICYPKHFALNDQETARDGELNMSWADEQTMREIYFKPFQMVMQDGNASGCMTAFARIGSVASPDNYNLLTGMVRKQWGWQGYFVTDGYEGASKSSPMDLMVRCGNDLALGTPSTTDVLTKFENGKSVTTKEDRTMSGTWNAALRGGKGSVEVGKTDKVESITQYYLVRNTAERMLFKMANSVKTTNGIKLEKYTGKVLEAQKQGTALENVDVKADSSILNGAEASYALVAGELPSGVTLNYDGSLNGTPTTSGSYKFTVQCIADNWQVGQAEFSLDVASAFTWDGDDVTKAQIGKEFYGVIDSETVTAANYTSITYSVADGQLPDGLAINEKGEIVGTPTKAGVFSFTIKVLASKKVVSWPFSRTTNYDYFYSDTITVSEAEADSDEKVDYDKKISDLENSLADAKDKVASATEEAKKANDAAEKANKDANSIQSLAIAGISIGSVGIIAALAAVLLFIFKKK